MPSPEPNSPSSYLLFVVIRLTTNKSIKLICIIRLIIVLYPTINKILRAQNVNMAIYNSIIGVNRFITVMFAIIIAIQHEVLNILRIWLPLSGIG